MNFKLQTTYPSASEGISSYNTLTYLHPNNTLVLYGLQKPPPQPQSEQPKKKIAFKATKGPSPPTFDKISLFSLQARKWEVTQAKGKIPIPRTSFATIEMSKCFLIYGGLVNSKPSNEVYALNIETMMWKKLFIMQNPPASQNFMLIKISQSKACLYSNNSIWILQVEAVKWNLASNELPGAIWTKVPIQFSNPPLFIWNISEEDILCVGKTETQVINIKQPSRSSVFQFNIQSKLMSSFQTNNLQAKITILAENPNFSFSNQIVVALENRLYILEYQIEGGQKINLVELYNQQNQQSKEFIELEKKIHCLSIVQNSIFYLDKNGELMEISLNLKEQSTTRLIPSQEKDFLNKEGRGRKKQGEYYDRSCIEEEEEIDQSSSYLLQNSSSQVKIGANQSEGKQQRQFLMKSHDSLLRNQVDKNQSNYLEPWKNQKKKQKSSGQSSQFCVEYEDTEEENSELLKKSLNTILTHQHLKRKLLQEKVDSLEQIIKKSEKFVLLLSKYGQQREKIKHIEKVLNIKQELQVSWRKQNYFRKQMQGDKIPFKIRNLVDKVIGDSKREVLIENQE